MHPKGAGSQEPLPILDGVLIVRRKEAKPALAIGFGVGGMVGARGEIDREQRADPVIEKKDTAWCQHASDLYQDCERVVEDVQNRGHIHQVHRAGHDGEGLGGGVGLFTKTECIIEIFCLLLCYLPLGSPSLLSPQHFPDVLQLSIYIRVLPA